MKRWLIEKLGGYADIDAALEAARKEDIVEYAIELARNMPLAVRSVWLTMAVKRHFNTVGPDDILKVHSSGHWLWKGKPISQEQIKLLKAEAVQLQSTLLWKVLKSDLQYQANHRMYTLSETEIDMVAGKLLVYLTDVVETRLKRMLEGKNIE